MLNKRNTPENKYIILLQKSLILTIRKEFYKFHFLQINKFNLFSVYKKYLVNPV